ncbi:hypothetical protein RchiOBHm_Chr7g0203781 [Rosa chinensis]|uniref:Uncharacterized protein n=1 Tax=Rosa chinensis TaxID=74649 RepID=A0A2P6P8J5_ROSCH|nr:hypothetical protein RchiOBHm_Chr7g0203781 [Rosa chinensis]
MSCPHFLTLLKSLNCGEGMEGGSVTIAAIEGHDLILFLGSWVLGDGAVALVMALGIGAWIWRRQ